MSWTSTLSPASYLEQRQRWPGEGRHVMAAVEGSDVRLQWDPDHDPHGNKLPRRAIQLGLRGQVLRDYATSWCLGIEDVTDFVLEQHAHVRAKRLDLLQTPRERVYPVNDPAVVARLGLDPIVSSTGPTSRPSAR